MNTRTSLIIVAAAVMALGQGPVFTQSGAPGAYFIRDLGTLGGPQSAAFGVDENGQVAGAAQRSDSTTHAFVFDGSGLRDLGTLGGASSAASDLNRRGDVVGRSLTAAGNTVAFVYSGGALHSIGTLGGSDSAAYGVNESGSIVGAAATSGNAATQAFLYRNGAMTSLGTLGGTNSVAMAINEVEEIAGSSSTSGNAATHAFLFRSGTMTDLGTLGGSSEGLGVNDGDEVVGRSTLASGATHAFLYSGGTMRDLGTLGGRNSEAAGINDTSQVVGMSEVAGASGTHAFLYQNGTMIDLNTRLPDGSGWVLESATAINSSGDIAGVGTINGERHAFRLSPPVTLTLFLGGALSLLDSNVPRGGVQVGRSITFVTSLNAPQDANAHNIVITDTMQGPIEIVGARSYQGNPCTVDGAVVTCRIPVLGPLTSFAEEIQVTVRVTAPGAFSHTAHATAENSVPNSGDTVREENIGIALKSFTLSAATVAGGKSVSARAELTSLAPPGGAVVKLTSSDPAIARVPSPFVVQLPTAVRTFNITPPVVSQPTAVTITATYGLVTISQTLTVVPPALSTISLTRSTMIGSCQTATAKVTLTGSAPAGGAQVALSSTTSGVHIPPTITVAAGATTASLTVTADAVHAFSPGTFAASFGGVSKQLQLAVRPIYVIGVALTPSTVTGGSGATGNATLECAAPAGGMSATLSSTNPTVAAPTTGSLSFAAGSTTASFAVRTSRVTAATTASIRVSANSVTKSASITVQP